MFVSRIFPKDHCSEYSYKKFYYEQTLIQIFSNHERDDPLVSNGDLWGLRGSEDVFSH